MLAQNLSLTIHNDVNAEETEFFTLRITARDVGSGVFDCYDDTEVPVLGNFLCSHTFFIVDEDGIFQQYLFECLCANRQCNNCSPDEIAKSSSTTNAS